MRILIDITDFLLHLKHSDTVTGIQRVVAETIKGLGTVRDRQEVFLLYYSFWRECFVAIPLASGDLNDPVAFRRLRRLCRVVAAGSENKRQTWLSLGRAKRLVRERLFLRRLPGHKFLHKGFEREDRVVVPGAEWGIPNYASRLKKAVQRDSATLILFCYDMIPIIHPEYTDNNFTENFSAFLNEIAPLTSLFISISETTKRDLLKFLHANKLTRNVTVVPLAHEFCGLQVSTQRDVGKIRTSVASVRTDPFILCVGTLEPRKNHWRLALAFENALTSLKRGSLRLVIAGRRGWNCDSFLDYLRGTANLDGHITWLDNPTDAELEWLYRQCLFSIFPSMYEGWGLPVGESLWFGKRCLASNKGAIPEVGGDAVDYFDPLNVDEITDIIVQHVRSADRIREFDERVERTKLRHGATSRNRLQKQLN